MEFVRVFLSWLFLFLGLCIAFERIEEGRRNDKVSRIKVRGVVCNASEKFIHKNVSCYPKSYNRSFSTVNVFVWTIVPLETIFVRLFNISCNFKTDCKLFKVDAKLFYKYGTIYRDVIHTPTRADFCQFSQVAKTNLMIQQIAKIIDDIAPGLLHDCPYTVSIIQLPKYFSQAVKLLKSR